METLRPQLLVELGTHTGFSYFSFCQAVQQLRLPTRCYAVDTWEGDEHAGFYGEEVFATVNAINEEHYKSFSQLMRSRFDQALPYFPDNEIDLLHIDGRHGYDDVLEDFTTWQPKLSDRAVVLFHDTNVRERDFGVWKLWRELSTQYPSFEFFHCHGLGVLGVGADLPEGLRTLFASGPEEAAAVRATYSALGSAVSRSAHNNHLHSELHRIDHRANQLQHEAEHLKTALEQSRTHGAQLENETAHLRDIIAEQQIQIEAGNELRLTIAERGAAILTLRNELTSEREEAAAKLVTIHRQLEQQSAVCIALTERLSLIESSTFWRAGEPLRRSLRWIPTGIRRNARRAAKAAWWTITPHRMPERLRFLRARRAVRTSLDGDIKFLSGTVTSHNENVTDAASNNIIVSGSSNSYNEWIAAHDSLTASDRSKILEDIRNLEYKPFISIVVPAYNTSELALRSMITSVQSQLYPYWELCIADDASSVPYIEKMLKEFSSADTRIKWLKREKNGHICAASNSALTLATGEFVGLLDHDDILSERALYEVAVALNKNPSADIIYSDEDKIDEFGRRYDPYFKPDFSYDLLLGHNLINHFGVYRRRIIEEIGGFREGYEGSQDYDLALRAVEYSGPDKVLHIPAILYHWRQERAGSSFSQSQLDKCVSAARKAVQEALDRTSATGRNNGRKAVVEANPFVPSWSRVKWDTPSPPPLVSIIIPTRDRSDLLENCVEGLLHQTSYTQFEILIIDNDSVEQRTHDLLERYQKNDRIQIIPIGGEFNYSALNNAAARMANGEILLLLNNDTQVIHSDWLSEMVSLITRDDVGIVGAKLLYADGRVQHAGVKLGAGSFEEGPGVAGHFGHLRSRMDIGYYGQYGLTRDLSAVTGACLAIRKSVYDEVGGLDEVNLKVAFNDVDLCLRVRDAGYRVLWTPFVELFHLESVSRGLDITEEKRARFAREARWMLERWGKKLASDPFQNINFDVDALSFRKN
ncbi:glycosyltransferase family 2 protein [Pseudochelatococcus contaminans]|uniref:GT2 family glycosyltransferase/regulator of replication initiation timing n=1 Tax=Pseudochelatococcus contaminans TaxID=1538103 RepID=A0A7W5Z0Y1_9HYPH|nr:glycosyltransferase [Pseudochelatococcus contaminans]MBB3807987.1 GT2 family glycosyltransferase/regulator of replication initiation timing [Pseudochelatococcus contaminans]